MLRAWHHPPPWQVRLWAPSASYCGIKVSADSYRVDHHLVKSLNSFTVPTNRTDIRSFCGLIQQFQAFSPHLTEMLSPIRSLLSPKSAFVWEAPQQEAFSQVVRELTTPRILAKYTPGLPLRLETDAAQSKGLGMALWQKQPSGEWRILQCGSRHVTPAEARYSATEVELLAVVWAFHRTHLYALQAPTLSWWSTIVPLSPSSTPRRSMNCRPRAWSA